MWRRFCGELTVAQSEFSSPMYIYILIGGSTGGGMGVLLAKNAGISTQLLIASDNHKLSLVIYCDAQFYVAVQG